jgi:hypothetical protein
MTWKGPGKMRQHPNRDNVLEFDWRDWGKAWEPVVRISDIPAEIRTGLFQNMSQERYFTSTQSVLQSPRLATCWIMNWKGLETERSETSRSTIPALTWIENIDTSQPGERVSLQGFKPTTSWVQVSSATVSNSGPLLFRELVKVKVKVTLQLTVGRSVSQYVLVSSPIWNFWPEILFFFSKLLSCLFWGALSEERSGLSYVSLCHWSLQQSVIIYNYLHLNLKFTKC